MVIVIGTLMITVVLGVLLDQPMWDLVWKNMFLDSVDGLFAHVARALGATPVEWMIEAPFFSIILITS